VKTYPAKTGVNHSQSGKPSHYPARKRPPELPGPRIPRIPRMTAGISRSGCASPALAPLRTGPGGGAVPAVVIAAGASAVGLDYLNVQQKIAEFTTCAVYGRGGTDWSDAAQLPALGYRGRERTARPAARCWRC